MSPFTHRIASILDPAPLALAPVDLALLRTSLLAFALSLAMGWLATPWMRSLAARVGGMDHASSARKIHTRPIPRLGGIAIVGAFYLTLLGLAWVGGDGDLLPLATSSRVTGLFAGGAVIALLGIYDDFKGAGPRMKFAVQFATAGLMYWLGFRIDEVANPFGEPISLGWFGLPLTLLWIVGIINALNLIDGLDGLAGGVALVKVALTLVFAVLYGDPVMVLFSAALAGAILGFLRYNFNPASIFMGDTGSMFLGFVLATSAIQIHQKSHTSVALLVPVVALGLPIADTLLAMVRRAARGVPLFQPDRDHIHHRLLARGLSHRQSVLVLYAVTSALGLAAVLLAHASSRQAILMLACLAATGGVVLRRLGYVQIERTGQLLDERRRNLEVRRAIRSVGERLGGARDLRDVWAGVRDAAVALGASCAALDAVSEKRNGLALATRFEEGFDGSPQDIFRSEHLLHTSRPELGTIELGWTDGRTSVGRDTELCIERLCAHVQRALRGIEAVHRQSGPTEAPAVSFRRSA